MGKLSNYKELNSRYQRTILNTSVWTTNDWRVVEKFTTWKNFYVEGFLHVTSWEDLHVQSCSLFASDETRDRKMLLTVGYSNTNRDNWSSCANNESYSDIHLLSDEFYFCYRKYTKIARTLETASALVVAVHGFVYRAYLHHRRRYFLFVEWRKSRITMTTNPNFLHPKVEQ